MISAWTILYTMIFMPLTLMFEEIYYFSLKLFAHPGLAIIGLSLLVNFLVLPLYNRADKAQEAERDTEARLARGVAHIKRTFKGDEQFMLLRTYYRQNHYSPTSVIKGSVSLLLEIPFFVAAYQFLSHLDSLHGVSFGPIQNLGAPDGMLSLFGVTIHVLPFVMTVINLLAVMIFTKGFPRKTKIQLYGMALFFLVFLYNSPAGLVFYWTLNNLFNLVKTIINRLPNPQKGMYVALFAVSALILIYCGCFRPGHNYRHLVMAAVMALALNAPYLRMYFRQKRKNSEAQSAAFCPKTSRFLAEGLFLSLFIGGLIPSSVIVSSPQEFVVPGLLDDPVAYIVSSLALAIGVFLLWFGVFYWLGNQAARATFESRLWIFAGIALINDMAFGRNFGFLTATLRYENEMKYSATEQGINAAVLLVAGCAMFYAWKRWGRYVTEVLLVAGISILMMLGLNIYTIEASLAEMPPTPVTKQDNKFPLSRNGKNVVVIMLDRAIGLYVPYFMQEKPELQKQFDGFTYYANTLSYGGHTNIASPGLFGGYDYIPEEMNRRKEKTLREKHNEALRLMPLLFDEAGYAVTVSHIPYPNYNVKPGLGIYDDHPHIRKFSKLKLESNYGNDAGIVSQNFRNFFCFAIVKVSPVCLQGLLYSNGTYNGIPKPEHQVMLSPTKAVGMDKEFARRVQELEALPELTEIRDGGDTFLMMVNETTHCTNLLSVPDYVLSDKVDNTAYEETHRNRFTYKGMSLRMQSTGQYQSYQTNMAALLRLGRWFDDLRARGVYDNTRIILVADHGYSVSQNDAFNLPWKGDIERFYPLLMVKDFGATGWQTSEAFMTNADVPLLAFSGLISNPRHPDTGRAVTAEKKQALVQYVFASWEYNITKNNGNTYKPGDWYAVHTDMRKKENWSLVTKEAELPE